MEESPYKLRDLNVHWVPKGSWLPCVICGEMQEIDDSQFFTPESVVLCDDCVEEIEWEGENE